MSQPCTSGGVCGTLQSSLLALAKLAQTIVITGLSAKCAPKAAIMVFFFARKVGSQNTGMTVCTPASSKVKKVPPARVTALVTHAGLPAWVLMRRSTCLPAAVIRETSESRKLQSKIPSLGSRSFQSCRILTPSTLGFVSTASLQALPAPEREKTPCGTAAESESPKTSMAPKSSASVATGVLKTNVVGESPANSIPRF